MTAEELKTKLREIFGSQIIFNKEFDKYAGMIKNIDENLISWCQQLLKNEIIPKYPPKFKDSLIFIKKMGSANRCIVIKIKNGEFTEVHLGDHDYYDRLRKILGLKENS